MTADISSWYSDYVVSRLDKGKAMTIEITYVINGVTRRVAYKGEKVTIDLTERWLIIYDSVTGLILERYSPDSWKHIQYIR